MAFCHNTTWQSRLEMHHVGLCGRHTYAKWWCDSLRQSKPTISIVTAQLQIVKIAYLLKCAIRRLYLRFQTSTLSYSFWISSTIASTTSWPFFSHSALFFSAYVRYSSELTPNTSHSFKGKVFELCKLTLGGFECNGSLEHGHVPSAFLPEEWCLYFKGV